MTDFDKLKVHCDYVEKIAENEKLDLLGVLWDEKQKHGMIMIHVMDRDTFNFSFLVSMMIAKYIQGLEFAEMSEDQIKDEMVEIINNAKAMSEKMVIEE